jgi:hypothetical protein
LRYRHIPILISLLLFSNFFQTSNNYNGDAFGPNHWFQDLYVKLNLPSGILPSFADVESPRKQVQDGVAPEDVKCKDGFELALKIENGLPVCLSHQTLNILVERGWAMLPLHTHPSVTNNTSIGNTTTGNVISTGPLPPYNLAFILSINSPNYTKLVPLFSNNLKPGDTIFLLVGTHVAQGIAAKQQLESLLPQGVNIITANDEQSISQIFNKVPSLPQGLDLLWYDYEDWSETPEHTFDQNGSISYFGQARQIVSNYNQNTGSNAKLLVSPLITKDPTSIYPDWGEIAQHMDMVDIQLEILEAAGEISEMKSIQDLAVSQIMQKSPNTQIYIQLGLAYYITHGDPTKTVTHLNQIHNHGVKGYLIFYNDNVDRLSGFFNVLNR